MAEQPEAPWKQETTADICWHFLWWREFGGTKMNVEDMEKTPEGRRFGGSKMFTFRNWQVELICESFTMVHFTNNSSKHMNSKCRTSISFGTKHPTELFPVHF